MKFYKMIYFIWKDFNENQCHNFKIVSFFPERYGKTQLQSYEITKCILQLRSCE